MAKHHIPVTTWQDLYLSRREVISLLNISRLELWNKTRRGEMQSYRLGGCIYYKKFDIEKLAEGCKLV
ncbi:hypothetical protein LX87_00332 [Larkinella arboricola]|uniref:Helix-turn-helix protein n=1 Tax=Larkinella arboricola TaxID=643671 RepID=A0A327X975_LARAB|nr:hypothetical protein LX87_00332 [Larkinella arboricola]